MHLNAPDLDRAMAEPALESGLSNAYESDGDGEDSGDESGDDKPCRATQGEFRRIMKASASARRETAVLRRRLDEALKDLDRSAAAEAASEAALANTRKLNRVYKAERDVMSMRLTAVETTLRNERDEHAPVQARPRRP